MGERDAVESVFHDLDVLRVGGRGFPDFGHCYAVRHVLELVDELASPMCEVADHLDCAFGVP